MKQLTLNIDESKYKAFLDFIKTLDYVEVELEEDNSIEEFKQSLKQVRLMKEGKLPKQNIRDFLNEL